MASSRKAAKTWMKDDETLGAGQDLQSEAKRLKLGEPAVACMLCKAKPSKDTKGPERERDIIEKCCVHM